MFVSLRLPIPLVLLLAAARFGQCQAIDRHALVSRHDVVLTASDVLTPITLGNGDLGFTADVTGMQTFPDEYDQGLPLGTLSQWGWHSFPNPDKFVLEDVLQNFDSHGRAVPYAPSSDKDPNVPARMKRAVAWLRENPHRIDLGHAGLVLRHADGSPVNLSQLTNVHQRLELWTGRLQSAFEVDGVPVRVTTVCHPERDSLAFRIESPLLRDKRAGVFLAFPYASGQFNRAADWSSPERHTTQAAVSASSAAITNVLDATSYSTVVRPSAGGVFEQAGQHRYEIFAAGEEAMEIAVEFSPRAAKQPVSFGETASAAATFWKKFWTSGGAIDVSGSTDPRATELERRIVLSEYLTAVNSSGRMPSQETGLEMNSWYGKFHLEMSWWHEAHFALWGRPELLERSMGWYGEILDRAQETAKRQGYKGARWPKMVGPDGRESPSDIGDFLIWQQPHPIFLAELLYRAHASLQTLQRYSQVVFETARFMTSFAFLDAQTGLYVLGPPIVPAQESYGASKQRVQNPTFELAYWQWALQVAQQWRKRLGMAAETDWDRVSSGMAAPTVRDGVYTAIGVAPYTFRTDHPSMLAGFGMLPPTALIQPEIMRHTLDDVLRQWEWPSTWGWDYPMMAMTAARLGEPEKAIDLLMMDTPKNRYLANGNNYQTKRLPTYLPGNGGLLYAVAMMAAGWDGAGGQAPGFPKNGKWHVRFENLRPAP